jgi:hypothetical protein
MTNKNDARREILDVLDDLENAFLPRAAEGDRFSRWIVKKIKRLRVKVQ